MTALAFLQLVCYLFQAIQSASFIAVYILSLQYIGSQEGTVYCLATIFLTHFSSLDTVQGEN